MDVREKLVELLADLGCNAECCKDCEFDKDIDGCVRRQKEIIADRLIAHDVTVQEHGYLETVAEAKDNTVCGNGVKIEYKRCSCCKNQVKFFEDDFCGNCGAKLDLPQPPKGE